MKQTHQYFLYVISILIIDIVIYSRLSQLQQVYELSTDNSLLCILAIHKRNTKEYKLCYEEHGLLIENIPSKLEKITNTGFALNSRHRIITKILSQYELFKSSEYVYNPSNWYA